MNNSGRMGAEYITHALWNFRVFLLLPSVDRQELAEWIDCTRQTIIMLEQGRCVPSC
jgi:hypothetical protein